MEPRCPGLKSPWAIMRPRASKSAAEKSRPSRTACEYAVFRSAVPASSAIEWSAAQTTPFVIASTDEVTAAIALCPHDVDDEIAVLVHERAIPGQEHDGRLALLDHGGAPDPRPGAEEGAGVHPANDEAPSLGEIDGT